MRKDSQGCEYSFPAITDESSAPLTEVEGGSSTLHQGAWLSLLLIGLWIPIGSTRGESLTRDALLQTGGAYSEPIEIDPPWRPRLVDDLHVFGNTILPASAEILVTSEEPEPPILPVTSQADLMCEVGAEELELERFKRQALQSVSIEFGGVSRLDSEGLRNGYLEMGIGSGLPLGSLDRLLGVTRVRIDWLGLQDSSILPQGYEIASDLYQFELPVLLSTRDHQAALWDGDHLPGHSQRPIHRQSCPPLVCFSANELGVDS